MRVTLVLGILFTAATAVGAREEVRPIRWEKSLDAAKLRAATEGKPILFHQLVGDLDKEGC